MMRSALLFVFLLGVAHNSPAQTTTCRFAVAGPNSTELTFTERGRELEVRGYADDVLSDITQTIAGLGIDGNGNDQINFVTSNEWLAFEFIGGHSPLSLELFGLAANENAFVCGADGDDATCAPNFIDFAGSDSTNPIIVDLTPWQTFDTILVGPSPNGATGVDTGLYVSAVTSVPEPGAFTTALLAALCVGVFGRSRDLPNADFGDEFM